MDNKKYNSVPEMVAEEVLRTKKYLKAMKKVSRLMKRKKPVEDVREALNEAAGIVGGDTMKHEINLDTMSKINKFVAICSSLDCKVDLIDGEGYRVSGKSLVGALATVDWTHVFVECERDIYSHIKDFLTE